MIVSVNSVERKQKLTRPVTDDTASVEDGAVDVVSVQDQ